PLYSLPCTLSPVLSPPVLSPLHSLLLYSLPCTLSPVLSPLYPLPCTLSPVLSPVLSPL
ncbi:PREDICTED: proline-rich protein 1-like, partial [Priapulus caudatus]|uniref:Proline-rich protein 1-like n=1 Tax=Priapulus caudatus TaxID=37621 RepID=A0ABM1F871_PRICU